MLSDPRADDPATEQNYIYDAWNRLVEVQDDLDATVAIMEYDGRNYRVQKTAGGVEIAFYHNDNQQLLETRVDGDVDPREQYIHDLRYIDSLIVRFFFDGDTNGILDNTLYYMSDANFNVTGLVDAATGNVVERYHYDPYGAVTYYDDSWTALTVQESGFENVYLFTGRRFEADILNFYYRGRYYAFDLGRFINRDPIGYGGGWNLYAYVGGRPTHATDPTGNATYRQNRQLNPKGLPEREARKHPVTHTFIYTTKKDGSIKNTYSWGNESEADNPARWYKDRPEDISAAKEAIEQRKAWESASLLERVRLPKKFGPKVGDDNLDDWIEMEFNKLRGAGAKSPSAHRNWQVVNNCKSESSRLVREARHSQNKANFDPNARRPDDDLSKPQPYINPDFEQDFGF